MKEISIKQTNTLKIILDDETKKALKRASFDEDLKLVTDDDYIKFIDKIIDVEGFECLHEITCMQRRIPKYDDGINASYDEKITRCWEEL